MIESVPWKRIIRAIVIGVALILLVFGLLIYWAERTSKLRWSEETLLSTKEMITVDLLGSYKKHWIPGESAKYRLHAITLSVSTKDIAEAPSPWRGKLRPILIDRNSESSEWIIVAMADYCDEWYAMGRPLPPLVQYRYKDAVWSSMPFEETLLDRPVDLLFINPSSLPFLRVNEFHLSLRTKHSLRDRPDLPLSLKDLVSTWPGNC